MAPSWLTLQLVSLIGVSVIISDDLGAGQRVLIEVGPRNITRTEGERNVYIPCPFAGSSSPMWIINGFHHEAFNLPDNMRSVSYGLLITIVTADMDGKSFQCIVPTGDSFDFHNSSIGTLYVEKLPAEYRDDINVNTGPTSISLDHQRMIFEAKVKAISWENSDSSCSGYQLSSLSCDDTPIFTWDQNVIQGTSVPIQSTSLVDTDNNSVYFKLDGVDSNGAVCQTLLPYFSIAKNDITDTKLIPMKGFCISFISAGPYIVLPSKSGGKDCPCYINLGFDNTYELSDSNCSCGDDTIFTNSFLAFKWNAEQVPRYHICFQNLTKEMNSTIIHFYELYRICVYNNGRQNIKPYRRYFNSIKLLIVLPDPPTVVLNITTGQVNFSSQYSEGIQLDFYQVLVTDVTNQTVVNFTVKVGNNISVGDLFQQRLCSPYLLTVEAHNMYGFTKSDTPVLSNNGSQGDECSCLLQYINTDLSLVNDDSGISIKINCSQVHYTSDIVLNITAWKKDVYINSTQALCGDDTTIVKVETLKCDDLYDFFVLWVPTDENDTSPCRLHQAKDMKVPCPEPGPENHGGLPLPYIIVTVVSGSSVLIISILVLTLIIVCVAWQKKKGTRSYDPQRGNS